MLLVVPGWCNIISAERLSGSALWLLEKILMNPIKNMLKVEKGLNFFLYCPREKDLTIFKCPNKWSVSGKEASDYINNHVIGAFEKEHPDVLKLLIEKGGGHYFILVRSMMSYLTWVAKLAFPKGTDTSSVRQFMEN